MDGEPIRLGPILGHVVGGGALLIMDARSNKCQSDHYDHPMILTLLILLILILIIINLEVGNMMNQLIFGKRYNRADPLWQRLQLLRNE